MIAKFAFVLIYWMQLSTKETTNSDQFKEPYNSKLRIE